MLKSFRLATLLSCAMLAGCSQSPGLGDLTLFGGTPSAAEAASPPADAQSAAAVPGELPPLPTRRPGKRPPAVAAAQASPNTPSASDGGAAAKSEDPGLTLASLGHINLFSATDSPDTILIDKPPVDAYSLLAQRLKYCWLNPSAPRLLNHGFHAEVAAGETKTAKMIIYEKAPDGRRGISAFKIDITAESSGSLVSTHNVRLDKGNETAIKADLARWANGDDRCKT